MSIDTNFPFALFKANLAFGLQVTQLLQQNRQQWLDRGALSINRHIAEASYELNELKQSENWNTLITLPGHALWRVLSRQTSDLQTARETAVANQTAFTSGLQEALAQWQHDAAGALGQAGNAIPIQTTLNELLQKWSTVPVLSPTEKATKAANGKTGRA